MSRSYISSLSLSRNSESEYEEVPGLSATPFRGPGRFIHLLDSENFKVPLPVFRQPLTPVSSPNVHARIILSLPSPVRGAPGISSSQRSSSSSPARSAVAAAAVVSSPQRSASVNAPQSPKRPAPEHHSRVANQSPNTQNPDSSNPHTEEVSTPKRSVPPGSSKKRATSRDSNTPKRVAVIPSPQKDTQPVLPSSKVKSSKKVKGQGKQSSAKPVTDIITSSVKPVASRKRSALTNIKDGTPKRATGIPGPEQAALPSTKEKGETIKLKPVTKTSTCQPSPVSGMRRTARSVSVKTAAEKKAEHSRSTSANTLVDKSIPVKAAAIGNHLRTAVPANSSLNTTVDKSIPVKTAAIGNHPRTAAPAKSTSLNTTVDKSNPVKTAAIGNDLRTAAVDKTTVPVAPSQMIAFPLSPPRPANKTRYLVNWVPILKDRKLFVEGLLLDFR